MATDDFFSSQTPNSRVKTEIVLNYFAVWSKVMIATQKRNPWHSQKIGYIDAFAGRGRYDDGTASTPIKILEHTIADADLRKRLVATFNEGDEESARILQENIRSLPGLDQLEHSPQVGNEQVNRKFGEGWAEIHTIPLLVFIDPYGYRDLTPDLVECFLKDWGCDSIFFFNYKRVNAAITNKKVADLVNELFGEARADELREAVEGRESIEREALVLEGLTAAFQDRGPRFVRIFSFRNARHHVSSHCLVFVSKHSTGYERMGDVMAKASSHETEGVPSFSFYPEEEVGGQLSLVTLETESPLDLLARLLLRDYAGRSVQVSALYEEHSMGRRYLLRNYKDALKRLVAAGTVDASRAQGKPKIRRGTMPGDVLIRFPEASS